MPRSTIGQPWAAVRTFLLLLESPSQLLFERSAFRAGRALPIRIGPPRSRANQRRAALWFLGIVPPLCAPSGTHFPRTVAPGKTAVAHVSRETSQGICGKYVSWPCSSLRQCASIYATKSPAVLSQGQFPQAPPVRSPGPPPRAGAV